MDSRPVILVTGAARRIGRAIALDLARHGFGVALHWRSAAADAAATLRELHDAGAAAADFRADLADEDECKALVPRVIAHFGRLDGVVNNASLFEHDDVASFGYAAMERHWRANTAPAVVLARALHAHVAAAGAAGCVVNVLDQKLANPNPDHFSYTLSKAALDAATVMLAMALAPALRVCAVAPGVTLPSGDMSGDEFDAAHRSTPLRRSSSADDVAAAVRYLLGAAAVTGTTLLVDGGQHLQPLGRDVLFAVRAAKAER